MSVASYLDAGAVLAGRRRARPMAAISEIEGAIAEAGIRLIAVDETQARIALDARIRFGRGFRAMAGLNYGDCFAYALAKSLDAPLLFVGDDFRATDVKAAMSGP